MEEVLVVILVFLESVSLRRGRKNMDFGIRHTSVGHVFAAWQLLILGDFYFLFPLSEGSRLVRNK